MHTYRDFLEYKTNFGKSNIQDSKTLNQCQLGKVQLEHIQMINTMTGNGGKDLADWMCSNALVAWLLSMQSYTRANFVDCLNRLIVAARQSD